MVPFQAAAAAEEQVLLSPEGTERRQMVPYSAAAAAEEQVLLSPQGREKRWMVPSAAAAAEGQVTPFAGGRGSQHPAQPLHCPPLRRPGWLPSRTETLQKAPGKARRALNPTANRRQCELWKTRQQHASPRPVQCIHTSPPQAPATLLTSCVLLVLACCAFNADSSLRALMMTRSSSSAESTSTSETQPR